MTTGPDTRWEAATRKIEMIGCGLRLRELMAQEAEQEVRLGIVSMILGNGMQHTKKLLHGGPFAR
jgi:hypothetical protein